MYGRRTGRIKKIVRKWGVFMSAILMQKLIDIANGFTKYGLWKGGSEKWKFLKSSNTKIVSDIQKCEELYVMVYPNRSVICYEFLIPWVSIRSDATILLNSGYGYGSNNNLIRISHIKENEIATIKLEVCYENNIDYLENTDIWVYYR